MRFSNKCGVQLNLRRMDRFISMVILVVKPGVAQRHSGYLELHILENAIQEPAMPSAEYYRQKAEALRRLARTSHRRRRRLSGFVAAARTYRRVHAAWKRPTSSSSPF
jgi:hypothetical protein